MLKTTAEVLGDLLSEPQEFVSPTSSRQKPLELLKEKKYYYIQIQKNAAVMLDNYAGQIGAPSE